MATSGASHTESDESVSSISKTRLQLYFYILPLIAVPFVILVLAVLIVPTKWFAERAGVQYLMTMGYGASLHNANCQVVIYGDSTAMIGVYPEIIAARTGLSTCNIAEFEGMTMINDTLVLDQFLQNNPRPRFIVFVYAPESFDPQSQRHNPIISRFEAITYRLRQPHKLYGLLSLMKHPDDVFAWADHGVRLSLEGLRAKPFPSSVAQIRYATGGRVPFQDAPLLSCQYRSNAERPNKHWVNGLRSKYGNDGTTVLVDSVLLPACDPDLAYFRRELSGVIDNQLDPLPMHDYYSGGRHVNQEGSVPLSNMLAAQLLDRLSKAEGQ